VNGKLPAAEVVRRLEGDLDLLAVLTHSNGVDSLFGEGLFFCANRSYVGPTEQRLPLHGQPNLLPCYSGAECNRGKGLLFRAASLRTRVFSFLACGGAL